jgi:hypothetical protein
MLSSKQRKIDNLSAEAREARAGIVFASDHVTGELCASIAQITPTLEAYSKGRSHLGAAIIDMLIDLRHYCDSKGLSFEDLETEASERYREERADLGC